MVTQSLPSLPFLRPFLSGLAPRASAGRGAGGRRGGGAGGAGGGVWGLPSGESMASPICPICAQSCLAAAAGFMSQSCSCSNSTVGGRFCKSFMASRAAKAEATSVGSSPCKAASACRRPGRCSIAISRRT
eukprot:Skav202239  [mRNA]  locus=scaffold1417:101881:107914:- [translate_table: standard]